MVLEDAGKARQGKAGCACRFSSQQRIRRVVVVVVRRACAVHYAYNLRSDTGASEAARRGQLIGPRWARSAVYNAYTLKYSSISVTVASWLHAPKAASFIQQVRTATYIRTARRRGATLCTHSAWLRCCVGADASGGCECARPELAAHHANPASAAVTS